MARRTCSGRSPTALFYQELTGWVTLFSTLRTVCAAGGQVLHVVGQHAGECVLHCADLRDLFQFPVLYRWQNVPEDTLPLAVLISVWELFTGQQFLCLFQVDREYHVQKALFSAGFPVPEPLLYCSDVSVIGTEFYVMQHVQVGPPVWEVFVYPCYQLLLICLKPLIELSYVLWYKHRYPLILVRNADRWRLSLISASLGLTSHFAEIFSSVFNVLKEDLGRIWIQASSPSLAPAPSSGSLGNEV